MGPQTGTWNARLRVVEFPRVFSVSLPQHIQPFGGEEIKYRIFLFQSSIDVCKSSSLM